MLTLTLTLTLMLTLTLLLTRTLTLTLILTLVFADSTYRIHCVIRRVHYSSGFTTDFPVVLCHHSSAGVFQMMCISVGRLFSKILSRLRVRKYVPTRMMLCPRNFCGAPAYISSIGYALELQWSLTCVGILHTGIVLAVVRRCPQLKLPSWEFIRTTIKY